MRVCLCASVCVYVSEIERERKRGGWGLRIRWSYCDVQGRWAESAAGGKAVKLILVIRD